MKIKHKFCFALAAMAVISAEAFGQTAAIVASTDVSAPEHFYTLKNGNGVTMTSFTSPTQTPANAGKFAFFADAANEGAYFIYSVDRQKWVSYTPAASYSGTTGFATLVDSKDAAKAWKAEAITVNSNGAYQFSPYTTAGTAAAIYMNWFQGVGASNPLDGTSITVGLWTDNGTRDNGSRWTLTEIEVFTYTVRLAPGETVTINGIQYADGQTLTVDGSLSPADVVASPKAGKFPVVTVDNETRTITVVYYDLVALRKSAPYTQAWVYPKQQDQVGAAVCEVQDNVYTLYNNVLAASFLKTDNAIYFMGSDAMNLLPGTEPFVVGFGAGDKVAASQMKLLSLTADELTANPSAVGGAEHFAGKAIEAHYTYNYKGADINIVWRAVLRDGSHYLRTEMELTGVQDVDMYDVIAMNYNVDAAAAGSKPATVGNTRGAVIMSNRIFAGLETPTAYNTVDGEAADSKWELKSTPVSETNNAASVWTQMAAADVPARIIEVGGADRTFYTYSKEGLTLTQGQRVVVTVTYRSGNNRLNLDGVDLLQDGAVVASDYHFGFTGTAKENNTFSFVVPNDGTFTVRAFIDNRENITATSDFKVEVFEPKAGVDVSSDIVNIQGRWSRNTTLAAGQTWKVASVVGLVAQDGRQNETVINKTQKRRSFLAYSERERAVPWRAFPCYISWYELNINRNNAQPGNESSNMVADQVLDVLSQWRKNMFDKFGEGPASFVIDDGWDNYGTWTFHSGFPNEMRDIAHDAAEMNAGCGAWLGPVGGYGQSGNYRRSYWNSENRGGMVLSNPAYYQTFLDAAENLVKNQHRDGKGDYNFFKFDGISAQFSSVGPDNGDTGNENAEGIIRLEQYVRENLKEDIFFNTTVGTWASPFWYQITDATWRQENDFGRVGNNSVNRENWITYRDNLVHQNYVTNSPICPINTLMTHGFILSNFGEPAGDSRNYQNVLNELRCAFACGSGMVELYNDYALMNSINGGLLWADLAECIRWQKDNADVLMDAHWVGGDPWTGSKAEVYGWGAWNGDKACLTLRNGANDAQTFTTTLRQALEIPANISGSIVFHKAFADQADLAGLTEGSAISIDTELSLNLPGSSVYVLNGRNGALAEVPMTGITFDKEAYTVEQGSTIAVNATVAPANATVKLLVWSSDNEAVATVSKSLVKGVAPGEATITATSLLDGQVVASVKVTVTEKVREPYSINFDKNATHSHAKAIKEIVFAPAETESQTLTIENRSKNYQDLTADETKVLVCKPGEDINVTIKHEGAWMHGYVYIDRDNDGQFSFNEGSTDQSNTDLVSFFFYSGDFSNDASGVNSLGASISGGSRNPGAEIPCPVFAAPTTEGTYRIRFKEDWNSVDAGGQIGADGTCTGTNGILANNGTIVDAVLKVRTLSGIDEVVNPAGDEERPLYDLQGRRVVRPVRGIYVSNGRKVLMR